MDPILVGSIITGITSLISSIIGATANKNRNRGNFQQNMQQGMNPQGQMGQSGGMGQQYGLPKGALQIPKYGPEGMQGISQLLSSALQGLQQQGQPSFGPIRQNAMNDFYSNIVPGIAERFAGTSRRSSGLEGALGAAGAGLSSNLGAMEQGFNLQNRNSLLNQAQLGLTSPYESIYKTRQPGFGENLAAGTLPALIESAPQWTKMISDWVSSSRAKAAEGKS